MTKQLPNYRKTTKAQLELWLIDPTTRNYLFSLWASRDIHKEIQGNGGCIDFESADKTFANLLRNEGTKEGYTSAMNPVNELLRSGLLEGEEIEIDLPEMDESILDEIISK